MLPVSARKVLSERRIQCWSIRPTSSLFKSIGTAHPNDRVEIEFKKEQLVSYEVEGRLLEVCNCSVICPCWIGEDPDHGSCDSIVAYHIDKGTIEGVDVSGHTLALMVFFPGNVLEGKWKVLAVIDDNATEEQQQAILKVWTGQLGGPIGDFAGLISEVVGVERAPISFEVSGGEGQITVGELASAELEPYVGTTGATTTLHDSVFSTIPGSPAYVSKARSFKRTTEKYGLVNVDLSGRNAVQGDFHFVN